MTIEQQRKIQQLDERQRALAAEDRAGTWLGFVPVTTIQPFTDSGTYFYAGIPRATVTPRRLRVWAYVAIDNDGGNYYTIAAKTSAGTTIASVTTGGATPITDATWSLLEDTTMASSTLTAASDQIVQIVVTKTGTPGSLSLIPMFYVL